MSKRMTLVIGAMCSDGMLFCSDTEESTSMGGKRAVKKLFATDTTSWCLVVGAAGFGPLCDIAAKRICDAACAKAKTFAADHEHIIENEIRRIYAQYIPSSLPDWKQQERQIALVIGVIDKVKGQRHLYATYEEIVQPIAKPFACVGAGQELAYYFLDRVFQDLRMPMHTGIAPRIHEAERLLQFVMKEAKSAVGGVSGNTETITIPNDSQLGTSYGTFGAGWEGKQPNLQDELNHFWLDNSAPMQPPPLRSKPLKRKSRGRNHVAQGVNE